MLQFAAKAILSGIVIATVATLARRSPALGAMVASLPLVSIMGMLWLWHDTHDRARLQQHVYATFWYVLPSLPMFLLIPAMLRAGTAFPTALATGCATTILLYLAMTWAAPRLGLQF